MRMQPPNKNDIKIVTADWDDSLHLIELTNGEDIGRINAHFNAVVLQLFFVGYEIQLPLKRRKGGRALSRYETGKLLMIIHVIVCECLQGRGRESLSDARRMWELLN